MISPASQKIIQIDITNVCPHRCSNCTRFVGHHKKSFFMSPGFFKCAVDSLKDFPGMIGVMGGEPTLHPQFGEIMDIYDAALPKDELSVQRFQPQRDFAKYRNHCLSDVKKKRGLWTSLGPGYARHYERIQDVFGYQCVNDHSHRGEHVALLMPRRELGISDDMWVRYRDACWIQNEWSAAITPKGAFFCEVAAALDMLFDGPGGWKVESSWWRRTPKDFGDQLRWCELCSACLPVPKRVSTDGADDVAPGMAECLKKLGSKKPMAVFDVASYEPARFKRITKNPEPYLPQGDNSVRVSGTNRSIKTGEITALIVCEGYDDYLGMTLPLNVKQVDRAVVVTGENDAATAKVAEENGAIVLKSKRLHEGGAPFAKGKAINDALTLIDGWVLLLDADIILPLDFKKNIQEYTLNPGCLYFTRRWGPEHQGMIIDFMTRLNSGESFESLRQKYASREIAAVEGRHGNATEHLPFGYFQLFNTEAETLLARGGEPYCEGSNTAEYDDKRFGFETFPCEKVVTLPIPEFDVVHLPHGLYRENWEGRRSVRLENVSDFDFFSIARYVCMKKCQYRSRSWVVGEILETKEWDVPKYFQRIQP